MTLERIDNDGNYEPGNVRWASKAEQNRNTRRNRPNGAIALKSDAERIAYLNAALVDGDVVRFSSAVDEVMRACSVTDVAKRAGVPRENLYRKARDGEALKLRTVLTVLRGLGMKIAIAPADQ